MTIAETAAAPHGAQTDDAAEDRRDARILMSVLIALAMWGVSIAKWGVLGLYLPALALVPVMYVVLIIISRG